MQHSLAEPSNEALAEVLRAPVVHKILLGGGGNSRLYKIETADGEPFVVKQYLADRPNRDPLQCEFVSLEFLWANGIRCVPRPVATLPEHRCTVLEFVEGQRLSDLPIADADLDQFCTFVDLLRRQQKATGVERVPLASEACFTPPDLFAAIDRRIAKLSRVEAPELRDYLRGEFADICEGIRQRAKTTNQPDSVRLARSLSPSDFGIHNAIRRSTNAVAFVDFEYFGWDDPAKMICDFLWHPANEPISDLAKRRLAANMIDTFDDQPDLAGRVRLFYPICGLNWCLILLNEFLPDALSRRLQAQVTGHDDVFALRQKQLARSVARLEQIAKDPQACPYP